MIRLTAVGLVGTVVSAVLAASIVLQGPRLGKLIEGSLPENKGKLKIGGVTWRLRALVDIVTDNPSPIAVDGLQIVDPEGTVVLDVPHLDARVKLRTLIAGSFSIHDLRAPVALWRFAAMQHSEGIGFLAALAPKNPSPPPPPSAPKRPGSFFEIASVELGDLNAIFDFPGSWGLELRHAHARASLKQDGTDPDHPTFGFDAGPVLAAGGGWLRILDDNVLPFDRVVINRVATTQEWSDDIFLDLAGADTGRSKLTGKGFFTGIYGEKSIPGIKLSTKFTDAADALDAVVKGKNIDGLEIAGDGATVDADLQDQFIKLKVAAKFRGLEVRYDSYRALGLGFDLGFDAGAGKVDVERFGFGAPGGGKLGLEAHLDTNRLALDVGIKLTDFHTESYVPRALAPLAGGRLTGQIDARADLARKSARLPKIALTFTRARAAGLPREVRVRGNAALSPASVKTDGLTVSVTGAEATAKGSVDLERQMVDLGLTVVAAQLEKLLKELGLPPLAKDARVEAKATGPFENPTATGEAVVHGAGIGRHKLPELVAKFGLGDGVARLDRLSGPAFGGRIDGKGTLRLWEKRASKPLRSPVVAFELDARDLDLSTLAGSEDVAGRLSFHAAAQGPLDALGATVSIPAGTAIEVMGEKAKLGPVEVALEGKTLAIRKLHLARDAGGRLDVTGKVGLEHQDLDLSVALTAVPLAGLPGIAESDIPVGGTVTALLHVGGRPESPQLQGDIDFAGVTVRGVKLGSGHLALAPTTIGHAATPGVAVRGRLFDRFDVDAKAGLGPKGLAAHAELEFRRVELEALAPELVAFGDGRGIASGHVTVDVAPDQPLAVDVLLPELWLSIARAIEGANGETTMQRVRVEAKQPIHVTVRGDRIQLDQAYLATNGGDLKVQGRLDGKKLTGDLSGHLDLELVQPFLVAAGIDRLSGALDVALTARGTLDKPDLRGQLSIASPVRLRPKDFDRDIVIGSGMVALDVASARLQNLAVTVDGSTMRFSGQVGLGPGFAVTNIEADIDGDISARLLTFIAPDAIADAQGRAHVRARLRGTPQKPEVRGRLDLGAITCRLRGFGNEVQVHSGIVEISNEGLILHNVKVALADGGTLTIGASGVRPGRVQFESLVPFKPGEVDLPLHGEQLTYRSPEVFEVDDLSFDLDMQGDMEDGLELGGEVRLVSGRYLQDFKVQDLVISPRVNESSVRPFYDGKPLLENLGLDLSVRTVGEGFFIQNNIAPEIHLDILLHVGGTLSAPTLAGDVRPTDGRFNIPFMRGDFDLTANVNHITFVETKSLADGDTPELQIDAENHVVDANGQDRLVHMSIRGPIREAQIDLSGENLDKNQAAVLLLTGRTTTDSQRVATGNPTVGANVGTAGAVAGQASRDTVANLMEPYIDDTFYRLTGMNLRLTVGSDGFQGRVRKRISRRLNLQSDYLQGFQNNSNWKTTLDMSWIDYFSVGGGVEKIRTSAQQGLPESLPANWKFELRLDYAIRR